MTEIYPPITTMSGVEAVAERVKTFEIEVRPDGLSLTNPNHTDMDVVIPDRLHAFLLDLRLLRRVPLSYLIPDAALLPPESIRFFNIDLTWVDRVVDGVLAAARTGTIDFLYSAGLIRPIRRRLDMDLMELTDEEWDPQTDPVTGVLIRSELVRRWPGLVVEAFHDTGKTPSPMSVLRNEPISRDILIALFAGRPRMVHIREPEVGIRFGVEPKDDGYVVGRRGVKGEELEEDPVLVEVDKSRKLKAEKLAKAIADAGGQASAARMVAIHLEQKPYLQEFKDTVGEERGSVPLPEHRILDLSGGRFKMDVSPLAARLAQAVELEKD